MNMKSVDNFFNPRRIYSPADSIFVNKQIEEVEYIKIYLLYCLWVYLLTSFCQASLDFLATSFCSSLQTITRHFTSLGCGFRVKNYHRLSPGIQTISIRWFKRECIILVWIWMGEHAMQIIVAVGTYLLQPFHK